MAGKQGRGTIGPVTVSATSGVGLAGAAAIIIVWGLGLAGIAVPNEVAGAIAVLIGGAGALIGGKLVPPARRGRHRADPDGDPDPGAEDAAAAAGIEVPGE